MGSDKPTHKSHPPYPPMVNTVEETILTTGFDNSMNGAAHFLHFE